MKKILFSAAMVLAVVLVGCKPDTQDNKYTSISLKPNELTMICGDTTQLSLLYQPTSNAKPNATWTSSDTNVVKVIGKGIITAKDTIGTATITAKVDDLTATCEVNVNTYQNLIGFDAITYFPDTKVAIGPIIDTTLASGTTYKIQLCNVTLFMPDTLGFDSETLYGEGYAIFADASLYFVSDASSQYDGYMLSDRGAVFSSDPTDADKEFYAQAGSFDPAIVGAAFEDTTLVDSEAFWAAYQKGVPGAYITSAEVSGDGVSYAYIHYGAVTDGYIGYTYDDNGDFAGTEYDLTVEWFNDYFGIAIDWEESMAEGKYIFKTPYEKASEEYHYTHGVTVKSAPRFVQPSHSVNNVKMGKKVNLGKVEKLKVMPREALR